MAKLLVWLGFTKGKSTALERYGWIGNLLRKNYFYNCYYLTIKKSSISLVKIF